MTPLVTLADIQAYESISSNLNEAKKLTPHILDAQEFDVRPLVGEEFWIAISSNTASYGAVWNETIYSHGGHTYQHPGLKAVIIMFAYARYKSEANSHDTPFGVVQKNNQYSTPVSDKTLARAEARAKAGAEVYFARVRDYLNRKSAQYPLWECAGKRKLTGNGLKIKKSEV